MRTILLAMTLFAAAGCHGASLPANGDGGLADMTGGGGGGGTRGCAILCTMGFTCCEGACVNVRNDIHNCGTCGVTCTAPNDFCDGQKCAPPPCSPACSGGTLCCNVDGPGPSRGPMCTEPTDGGTCPLGCPLCV